MFTKAFGSGKLPQVHEFPPCDQLHNGAGTPGATTMVSEAFGLLPAPDEADWSASSDAPAEVLVASWAGLMW